MQQENEATSKSGKTENDITKVTFLPGSRVPTNLISYKLQNAIKPSKLFHTWSHLPRLTGKHLNWSQSCCSSNNAQAFPEKPQRTNSNPGPQMLFKVSPRNALLRPRRLLGACRTSPPQVSPFSALDVSLGAPRPA